MAGEIRKAATSKRIGTEGLLALTPAGIAIVYFAGQLFPDMPEQVKQALVGLVVTGGAMILSRFRDRRHAGKSLLGVGLVVGLLLLQGCVSYDAAGYHRTASAEIRALSQTPAQLEVERCQAHRIAARALRDETGDASAFRGPLGAARALNPTADAHARQAAICQKFLELLADGRASQASIDRAFAAWLRQYRSGDALLGGN
jgi:outer membrane murein-binding lipoprotein Lpp